MSASILVPLDGSAFAEHALPHALAIARATQAPLRLVHVYEPIPAGYPALTPMVEPVVGIERMEWAHGYLEHMSHRLGEHVDVPIHTEVVAGSAIHGLLRVAGASDAGMIVLTSHGRGGLARVWLGSVADSLVRSTSLPVLVVRPGEAEVALDVAPPMRRIMVTLDGSALAEQALPLARQVAELTHASLTVFALSAPAIAFGYPPVPAGAPLEHADPPLLAYLEEKVKELQPLDASLDLRMAWPSEFAATIVREAAAQAMDLIVMSTHGRGGARRLVLGSVADKVLRATTVPLLLYRPRRATAGRQRALLDWHVPEGIV